jgi:hypothetical protein
MESAFNQVERPENNVAKGLLSRFDDAYLLFSKSFALASATW